MSFVSRASRSVRLPGLIVIGAVLACITACRYDMQDQPRYEIYRASNFFDDQAAARPLPEHTVARGNLSADSPVYTGRVSNGGAAGTGTTTTPTPAASPAAQGTGGQGVADFDPKLVTAFPVPVTRELLDQGQELYQTYCFMCHGLTGAGDGMIVRRGYRTPPSYHTERLRRAPVGHFFDVMTNGWGAMPSYSYLLTPHNRWAIAAYVRTLQLSHNADPNDVPAAERQRIEQALQSLPARPQASPTPAGSNLFGQPGANQPQTQTRGGRQ